jgi:site-specific DNA-methyltransferase (adenine-specific)
MDYSKSTLKELISICKENNIKGYSNKKKEDVIELLKDIKKPIKEEKEKAREKEKEKVKTIATVTVTATATTQQLDQKVIEGDMLKVLPTLKDNSSQIILADPPYNIGKDFGNKSDKQPIEEYLKWSKEWITECIRILKPNGTMFIYGFSETLALLLAQIPYEINRRWIVWHYTNKNVASLNFWQRSHESILVLWKEDKVFHRDAIREPYTDGFLKGAAGKERKATKGRFSNGEKTTTYNAHEGGALPRDVIKCPALAGGAGAKERVDHPTQKPLALCEKLLLSCNQPVEEGYVLVPFAGSGSECLAAKKLELPFIGIEINPQYVKLINERLAAFSSDSASDSVSDSASDSVSDSTSDSTNSTTSK